MPAGSLALPRRRRLSGSERALADRVFGGTLPVDRVLLADALGWRDRAFTLPLPGGTIVVAVGEAYDDPAAYRGTGRGPAAPGRAPGQLLVHELVHVWQMAHTPVLSRFLASAVRLQLRTVGGDMSPYVYGAAGPAWRALSMEQQASLVEHWYAGRLCPGTPQSAYAPEQADDRNPYWRYVRDDLRRPGA